MIKENDRRTSDIEGEWRSPEEDKGCAGGKANTELRGCAQCAYRIEMKMLIQKCMDGVRMLLYHMYMD